ncbi:MAG: di-heme oxidoredictase family protein [Candidatus Eisenbacteria bacterium]
MKSMRDGKPGNSRVLALPLSGCGDDSVDPPLGPDPRPGGRSDDGVLGARPGLPSPAPNVQNLDPPSPWRSGCGGRTGGGEETFGGLGPTYNSLSCAQCHAADGRTVPDSRYRGRDPRRRTSSKLRISTAAGDPVPGYGTVIQDQAMTGAVPEARITVRQETIAGTFADGETYELVKPVFEITDWYTGAPPRDFVVSPRIPARQVGLGLLHAVPEAQVEALASLQREPISGRPNRVRDAQGQMRMGRFGYKAQNADLDVARTFLSDIGVTSEAFPLEPYAEQSPSVPDSILLHAPDIPDADLDAVDYYFHTLGVPARRDLDDPRVVRGERIFRDVGCAGCHTPQLTTSSTPPRTALGTPVPECANQTIYPYTDLLLHDLGPDLADGYGQGEAAGSEWRTTPLWGIGLQNTINGHTYFLHDGRARNLMEAILWHGGESEDSREAVKRLPEEDREALIRFLDSL